MIDAGAPVAYQDRAWHWKRWLLIATVVVLAIVGTSGYVAYRILFHKNPEVVHEMQQADERQKALDDVFRTTPD